MVPVHLELKPWVKPAPVPVIGGDTQSPTL